MEFSYVTFISLFLLIVIVSFHQLYVTLMCLFLFIVIQSFYILFSTNKSSPQSGTLPPGKTGWPIMGETFEYVLGGWKGHPEKFILDRMNKYSSNVIKTHLISEKTVLFCGAAANKFLFSNENKLVEVWWPRGIDKIFPSSTITSSKEEAINLRNIMLQTFFKPDGLQRIVGTMDETAQGHFASCWENKDEVVAFPLAKRYTFWLACKLFLGVEDPNHVAKFADQFNKIASGLFSIPIDFPGTPFYRAVKATTFIRKEFVSIVKQRKIDLGDGKASPAQDILSQMLSAVDQNGKFMSEFDIADKILGLIVGGHDTLTSTCTSIVRYLAELPQIYEGVYKEQMEIANSKAEGELLNWKDLGKMKYSWNVACEVLRVSPPFQGTFREASVDFMFNGFSIPKGWKLHWNVYSTHKNSEYFPEPQKFDPSRFAGVGPAPYTFVPFGGGPRMCPGKEYARLVILVFMHHLVKRFKWEKVIPDEKVVVDPMPIPANGLPIRLYPHEKINY